MIENKKTEQYIKSIGLQLSCINIIEYQDPYIFSDGEYYFGYEIYDGKHELIASGQDCISSRLEIDEKVLKEEIVANLDYFLNKPKISEFGKIMHECFNTCLESGSGMCFIEPEYAREEFTEDELEEFQKEVEGLHLQFQGIIEIYPSVKEAQQAGEAYATCYGALGNYFNNI